MTAVERAWDASDPGDPTRASSSLLGAAEIADALGLPTPTPEQQAVIEAPLEPALVVAGAGSGKTETMANRVASAVTRRSVSRPSRSPCSSIRLPANAL